MYFNLYLWQKFDLFVNSAILKLANTSTSDSVEKLNVYLVSVFICCFQFKIS